MSFWRFSRGWRQKTVRSRAQSKRRPTTFCLEVEELEKRWLPAATFQDFNALNIGTPYSEAKHVADSTQGVQSLPGGPTREGSFLRLGSEIADGHPNHNSIAFHQTQTASANLIVFDFDLRITPRTGRADGFGFAWLPASMFGASGPLDPQAPFFAAEEPDFAGGFGVGFDIYNKQADGVPDDDRNELEIHNVVSIHFNGQRLAQIDATPAGDLANGRWNHIRILLRKIPDRSSSDVTVQITCDGHHPMTVVDRMEVFGLLPFAGRPRYAARCGGLSSDIDLDNVTVQYVDLSGSFLSLSNTAYSTPEGKPVAAIAVSRSGNLRRTETVEVLTEPVTAVPGWDYDNVTRLVTFRRGETTKTILIPIRNDATLEPNPPLFRVSLRNPRGGAVIVGSPSSTVAILDDETAQTSGQWSDPTCTDVAAIHAHLLPDGNVLYWDRLGEVRMMNPARPEVFHVAHPDANLFCGGEVFAPNGDLLVFGGHHHGGGPDHDGEGLATMTAFNYLTGRWETALPAMNAGRWYPTAVALATGEILVVSGSTNIVNGVYIQNPLPQVYNPITRTWRNLTTAEQEQLGAPANNKPQGVDLYPRLFPAPDGRVFKAGPDPQSWFLDSANTGHWTQGPVSSTLRTYGAAVLYAPGKVLVVGGGDPPTASAEKIDLNDPSPVWSSAGNMAFARRQLTAVVLPDGKVLVVGGSSGAGFSNEQAPVLAAELWDPASNTWTTLGSMQVPRLYHSTALLLPDGRVMVAGGGQGANATSFYNNAEFFSPPYLFQGSRPAITLAPTAIRHGQTFFVRTPDAARIERATLIRLPSVTHSYDQNARFIELSVDEVTGGVNVTAPADSDEAPEGQWMLFLLDDQGVPSIGRIVQVLGARTIQAQEQFIQSLTRDFLGRKPFQQEADAWLALLTSRGRAAVALSISQSPESLGSLVDRVYNRFLHRPATSAEQTTWVTALRRGVRLERLLTVVLSSPEYYALQGATNTAFVQGLFRDVLNREGSTAAVTNLVSSLASLGRSGVANSLVGSLEFRSGVVLGLFGYSKGPVAYQPLFANLLKRRSPPSAAELNLWAKSSLPLLAIASKLAATAEYWRMDDPPV